MVGGTTVVVILVLLVIVTVLFTVTIAVAVMVFVGVTVMVLSAAANALKRRATIARMTMANGDDTLVDICTFLLLLKND